MKFKLPDGIVAVKFDDTQYDADADGCIDVADNHVRFANDMAGCDAVPDTVDTEDAKQSALQKVMKQAKAGFTGGRVTDLKE